jgi:uncharacterized protein YkwD
LTSTVANSSVHSRGGEKETSGKCDATVASSGQNGRRAARLRAPVRSSFRLSSSMHQLKVLFALTAASALVACGGGGDSPAPPAPTPTPIPVPTPVANNGTLQTSVPAANYGSDTRRLNAFNQLDAVRQGAGAGLLAQSTALDTSAQDHSNYLTVNGFNSADSAHDETSGLTDFTGTTPFVRMQAAGYDFSYATEVIGDIGSSSASSDCVGDLLDTVYHAVSMLSRVTDVGFGYGAGAAAGMCTIDMGSPSNGFAEQIPPSGAIVAYPYNGSTVAHGTFHVSNESPRVSMALLPNATAGTPVVVGFRNQDVVAGGAVTITQFSIATAAGVALPAVILGGPTVSGANVNADSTLATDGPEFAVLVPINPLPAGTYTVTLRATITGGQALALTTWSFTVASQQ